MDNCGERKIGSVGQAWRELLLKGQYEPPPVNRLTWLKFMFLSRFWRRVLRVTGLKRFSPVTAFEFGCGGGQKLVPLYVNGWRCTGVDSSPEVLDRARRYVQLVAEAGLKPAGSIDLFHIDFIDYQGNGRHDITFHSGVLEHFLDGEERVLYLQKMFDITREGGYVVSHVPNGGHPMRAEQREKGLGGYNVPEMDYTRGMLEEEMYRCGAKEVTVLAHDLFGYMNIRKRGRMMKRAVYLIYLLFQAPIFNYLPQSFLDRHSFWWIAIAKK